MIKSFWEIIMFKYSDSNKRYYTLDYFYKHKFNSKVCKISLDGGFSCPNKDGTVGIGGCIYCSKSGSAEYAGDKRKPLLEQFNDVKNVMDKKWPNAKYIGYFQANTNTYAPVNILKEKYEPILKLDNVVGLSIGTRCDAISEECLEYLSDLNTRTFLTIELGLQTIHDDTSKLINRCHTLKCFEDMVKELRKRNINVVVHIINGLPYETKDMMIDTVKYLSNLDIQGIKIHALSILKGTELENLYNKTHFKILSREEYIDIVCDQLEYLRENIVVHRLTGDPMISELVEPSWLIKKTTILNDIDKEMNRRDSYQGIKYNKKSA
jgi:radical SAM protein (TIGR01212 family)